MADALLSVGVITYNQKDYIRKCLDSILSQKTNFKFEILINDDCSTDGTTEIIKEYAKKYPDIIKPVYQTENQFQKGKGILKNFIIPRVNTKYFAICEGDDFWCDNNKLQKQVDFLEAHSEYIGCFHPVRVLWMNNLEKKEVYPSKTKIGTKKIITKKDLLKCNYMQTNSVVYRWQKDEMAKIPDNILPVDLYIHLAHSKFGNFYYMNEVMAVYRKNEGGIWYDKKNLFKKYGLREINFSNAVYENITNKDKNCLETFTLPKVKEIMDNFYETGYIEGLKKIKENYPKLYDMAVQNGGKDKIKYRKYKALYNIFLCITIFLTILLLVLFFGSL